MSSLFLSLLLILLLVTQAQSARQTSQSKNEETALYTIIRPDISNDDVYHEPTAAHTESPINSYRLPPSPLLKQYSESQSDTAPPSPSSSSSTSSAPSSSDTSNSTCGPTSQSTSQPTTPPSTQSTTTPTTQPTTTPNRYNLTSYNSSNFFNHFDFETINDPTHGVVDNIDYKNAKKLGIAKYFDGKIFLGVDNVTVVKDWDRGRKSLRLLSLRVLHGDNIVVLNLDHMPSTVGNVLPKGCSLWPAFWTVGPHWPYSGEIDIIEYVNIDSSGTTGLHTSNNCDMKTVPADTFSSTWKHSWNCAVDNDCHNNAPGQDANSGCVVGGPDNSVGAAFNNIAYSDNITYSGYSDDAGSIGGMRGITNQGGGGEGMVGVGALKGGGNEAEEIKEMKEEIKEVEVVYT